MRYAYRAALKPAPSEVATHRPRPRPLTLTLVSGYCLAVFVPSCQTVSAPKDFVTLTLFFILYTSV